MGKLSDEDLTMLRDSARRFFSEQLPVSAMRKLRDDKNPVGFDRDLWRGMAGMGWAGILIDEQYGGVELGFEALGHILEQSGHTLAATPLVSTAVLGAGLLAHVTNDARRAELLSALSEGDLIVALAIDEQRRHAPQQIATRATRTTDGLVINGQKSFVLDGHVADQLVVVVRTSGDDGDVGGLGMILVPRDAAGVSIQRTHMVDGRNAANIRFEDVSADPTSYLGSLDDCFPLLDRVLDSARVGVSAEMLGAASEAFERTMSYLKIRTQFDVPIGSFQALKHRAAIMFSELELARSSVYDAASALDDERDDRAQAASLAKAKASSTFELISNEAVQMHGGIGMTDAEEIGMFLKRARVAQQTFGDELFHRNRWAALNGL